MFAITCDPSDPSLEIHLQETRPNAKRVTLTLRFLAAPLRRARGMTQTPSGTPRARCVATTWDVEESLVTMGLKHRPA